MRNFIENLTRVSQDISTTTLGDRTITISFQSNEDAQALIRALQKEVFGTRSRTEFDLPFEFKLLGFPLIITTKARSKP